MLIKWKSYRSNLFGFIAAQTICFEFKQLSTSLLTLVNTTQAACTYQWKFFLELCHKITPKVYNLRNFFFKFLTFLRLWNTSAYINASWLIAPLVLTTFCGPDRLASTLPSSGPISVLTWLLPKLMPKSITAVQRNRACRRRWLSLSMNFVAKIRACNYSGYPGRGTPKEKKRRIICINFSVAQWELARWVILTLKFVKDFYGHMYV